MIPQSAIQQWREVAPWADAAQVEQDLVITRALIQIYNDPTVSKNFAFRGGTALQKLFMSRPTRYSEDIDLVHLRPGPIGPELDAIRKLLDPWLGEPRRSRKEERFTLIYRFESEVAPVRSLRLKIEVNNGENFNVFALQHKTIESQNPWFSGKADVLTYAFEELLGTKLRALYQRKKGRDLYDMQIALDHFPELDPGKVIQSFQRYLVHQNTTVSRAQYEANLAQKVSDPTFIGDIPQLLTPDATAFDCLAAGERIKTTFLSLLPGEPWKGNAKDERSPKSLRKSR